MRGIRSLAWSLPISLLAILPFSAGLPAQGELPQEPPAAESVLQSPVIVIGILGGIVKRNDPVRSEVKLAEHLRETYPDGVFAETFENRHSKLALQTILNHLRATESGTLSESERHRARIILYGHSLGGSAVVQLARELEKRGIPVLLTIQVDSVERLGQQDGLIPPNVARAANFYQPNGLIHGRARIRAQDPSRTQIIGNYRLEYKAHPIACPEYPWYEKVVTPTHTEIACDPNVWLHVEALIRQQIGMKNGM
jgi:hypothetical protein